MSLSLSLFLPFLHGICTWVKENDGSQAAQLSFVHLHVSHLAYKLCQNPAKKREAKKRENLWVHIPVEEGKCQIKKEKTWQRKREQESDNKSNEGTE